MGAFAEGAGVYNVQTAQARSINANTAMRWNQYIWQSQQEANRRAYLRRAQAREDSTRARDEVSKRLRDNPSQRDIYQGDALNVALDEVSNPQVYLRNLKAASTKFPGVAVRDIPFQYAAAAITTSVEQVTKGGPPAALKTEAFAKERTELKALGAELHKQVEEKGYPDPASLQKVRDIIQATRGKVATTYHKGTRQRNEAEKFLKALYGLTRMLETPAMDVLLAGVENRPETTIGAVIAFMESFNLRFGVASTPQQRAVYDKIFPLLVTLRDEAAASLKGTQPAPALSLEEHERATEFFSGMDLDELAAKKPAAPPAPGAADSNSK